MAPVLTVSSSAAPATFAAAPSPAPSSARLIGAAVDRPKRSSCPACKSSSSSPTPLLPDLIIAGVPDLVLVRHRRPPVPHGPAQEEPKKKQLVGGRQGLTRVRVSVAYLQIRSIGFAGEVDEEARRKGPGITRPGLGFGMVSRRPEMGEEDGTRRGRSHAVVPCRSANRQR